MRTMQRVALLIGGVFLALGSAWAEERTFEIRYRAELDEIPVTTEKIGLWLPLPRSHMAQTIRDLHIRSSENYIVVQEPKFRNRFAYVEITDDETIHDTDAKPWIELTAKVTRKRVNALDSPFSMHYNQGDLTRFLGATSLVTLDGPIREEALRVVGDEPRPFEQAQLLYDHIVATVAYDKSGTGWGRGDSLFACSTRAGNCTEFHSLFMAEARALQIPARFLIGFSVPSDVSSGVIPGYHCWAEFFTPERGWVPVDASEARKDLSRKKELFGGLDANRVEFALGRDIKLPKSESAPVNFIIYPYLEINGQPSTNVEWTMQFMDIEE